MKVVWPRFASRITHSGASMSKRKTWFACKFHLGEKIKDSRRC